MKRMLKTVREVTTCGKTGTCDKLKELEEQVEEEVTNAIKNAPQEDSSSAIFKINSLLLTIVVFLKM